MANTEFYLDHLYNSPSNSYIKEYSVDYVDLPEEYQQVEYIEGNGSAYINTDYYPNSASRFSGHITLPDHPYNNTECFFGERLSYHAPAAWEFNYVAKQRALTIEIGSAKADTVSFPNGINLFFEITANKVLLNAHEKYFSSTVSDQARFPLYLFALNDNGISANYSTGKLYIFKIVEDNVLIKCFIPCYRKKDSEIGLYDIVEGSFYLPENSGSARFEKGPDVQPGIYDQIIDGELYLNILDPDFNQIAVIDNYTSLVWTDRYAEPGEIEFTFPYNKDILEYCKPDNLCRIYLSDHVMIIEKVEIEVDDEGVSIVTVSGRSMESILGRRVVPIKKEFFKSDEQLEAEGISSTNPNKYEYAKVSLQDSVETLIKENFTEPENEKRKIPNFVFHKSEDKKIFDLKIYETYEGDDILSIISDLCEKHNLGFKLTVDYWHRLNFTLYYGTDRSYKQDENERVTFSPFYDNLSDSRYYFSNEKYANYMIVKILSDEEMAILGVDDPNIYVYTDAAEPSGFYRREVYHDRSDLHKTDRSSYTLSERAKKKLELDYKAERVFDGEIVPDIFFKYQKDYFIGDIVQFEDIYGNSETVYISEIVITRDSGGLTVIPSFEEIKEEYDPERDYFREDKENK